MSVDSKDTDVLFRRKFFSEALHLARQYETREEAKKRSKARRKCVRELWKLGEYWLCIFRSFLWFALFFVSIVLVGMILEMTPNPICNDILPNTDANSNFISITIKGYIVWPPILTQFLYVALLFLNRWLWMIYNIGMFLSELQNLLFVSVIKITDPNFSGRVVNFNMCNETRTSVLFNGVFKDYLLNFLTQGPLNF